MKHNMKHNIEHYTHTHTHTIQAGEVVHSLPFCGVSTPQSSVPSYPCVCVCMCVCVCVCACDVCVCVWYVRERACAHTPYTLTQTLSHIPCGHQCQRSPRKGSLFFFKHTKYIRAVSSAKCALDTRVRKKKSLNKTKNKDIKNRLHITMSWYANTMC